MCGIAGFLQADEIDARDAMTVRRMGQVLAHRGPDDDAIWIDQQAGVALAHRRLAILDLTDAGSQPMMSRSGRLVLTFNGEIYNSCEIRNSLDACGHSTGWKGHSDTEVLLAAIEQWGLEKTLPLLNGMFAFAVWDRVTRELTLARDRMGEKPLYYAVLPNLFLFGSELKAIREHPLFKGKINRDAAGCMLSYDYIPAPLTIWEDTFKLEPGHYLKIKRGGERSAIPRPYWSLNDVAISCSSRRLASGSETIESFEALLRQSVRQKMIADVPLGAFLSGGIDSSLIAAMMQAESSRPVQTFTIGFDEPDFDEAPRAKRVAAALGTDHTELYVSPTDAFEVIPKLPAIWDEPFGDSSQIPTYLLSAMTRRGVKVALSGDGADELFGGYGRFRGTAEMWESLRRWPLSLRRSVAAVLGIGSAHEIVPGPLGRVACVLRSPTAEALYRWRVSRVQISEALVPGCPGKIFWPVESSPAQADLSERMMFTDTLTYLPDDILTKVDRASMAVGLEVRAPYLDHRLVEMSWQLPPCEKLGPHAGKMILRSLLQRYLPTEMANPRKKGFSVPTTKWLKGPLQDWASDLLSEDSVGRVNVLGAKAVQRVWKNFLSGARRHDRLVWNLLMLQAWALESR